MALDKIIKKGVILKRDTPVWKVNRIAGDKTNPNICVSLYNREFPVNFNESRIIRDRKKGSICSNELKPRKPTLKVYPCGFHVFLSPEEANLYIKRFTGYKVETKSSIVVVQRFTIPKGTRVTKGLQSKQRVIVTKVLINKRVKATNPDQLKIGESHA